LLVDGKSTNGGANDFSIKLPRKEMSSALMSLTYLKGLGVITGFSRQAVPNDEYIDITGYTG
jgi:hypothetical protein